MEILRSSSVDSKAPNTMTLPVRRKVRKLLTPTVNFWPVTSWWRANDREQGHDHPYKTSHCCPAHRIAWSIDRFSHGYHNDGIPAGINRFWFRWIADANRNVRHTGTACILVVSADLIDSF